jgi:hypothetical protein
LRELRQAEEALALHRAARSQPDTLTSAERSDFLALSSQLPAIWRQSGINRAQKKALLRSLIEKVILHRTTPECIEIRIVWRGWRGFRTAGRAEGVCSARPLSRC